MNRTIVIAFFIVSLCVAVPFLRYYATKNPDPRFRPRFGEMLMMSIFALMFCGGGSVFMAKIMGVNLNMEKMEEQMKASPSGGGSGAGDSESSDDSSSSKDSKTDAENLFFFDQ